MLSEGRPWTLGRPEVPKEEAGLGLGALDGWRRQLLPHRMEGKRRMRIEGRREFPLWPPLTHWAGQGHRGCQRGCAALLGVGRPWKESIRLGEVDRPLAALGTFRLGS